MVNDYLTVFVFERFQDSKSYFKMVENSWVYIGKSMIKDYWVVNVLGM